MTIEIGDTLIVSNPKGIGTYLSLMPVDTEVKVIDVIFLSDEVTPIAYFVDYKSPFMIFKTYIDQGLVKIKPD